MKLYFIDHATEQGRRRQWTTTLRRLKQIYAELADDQKADAVAEAYECPRTTKKMQEQWADFLGRLQAAPKEMPADADLAVVPQAPVPRLPYRALVSARYDMRWTMDQYQWPVELVITDKQTGAVYSFGKDLDEARRVYQRLQKTFRGSHRVFEAEVAKVLEERNHVNQK